MIKIDDYNTIMNDRDIFNQIVYTPLSEALRLLEERQKDSELMSKVKELLNGDMPEIFEDDKKYAVLFRQIATPNYETKRFIALAKENNLHPVIFEYHDDIFSPDNNEFKYSLGKLSLHKTVLGGVFSNIKENINIIDFNTHKGKKIKDIVTTWQEPLTDFHKFLFNSHFKNESIILWNASEWFKSKGDTALNYYQYFFLFFIRNGILFENFLSSKDSEGSFTQKVVLPAIEAVLNMTGLKPLIVPIEPFENELDEYWIYHNFDVKDLIESRKNNIN